MPFERNLWRKLQKIDLFNALTPYCSNNRAISDDVLLLNCISFYFSVFHYNNRALSAYLQYKPVSAVKIGNRTESSYTVVNFKRLNTTIYNQLLVDKFNLLAWLFGFHFFCSMNVYIKAIAVVKSKFWISSSAEKDQL